MKIDLSNDEKKYFTEALSFSEAEKYIKKFNKKIQEGVGFIEISDLLKMNSRITKKLNREDVINQGFSFEFTNKIFESKKNTIHENETSDNYYVVKVISDSEVKFNNERFNVVKKSVNKIYGIDNLQQITKILENKFPISVNKNLLNEFIDRLQY